jgi:hypothetical protein
MPPGLPSPLILDLSPAAPPQHGPKHGKIGPEAGQARVKQRSCGGGPFVGRTAPGIGGRGHLCGFLL